MKLKVLLRGGGDLASGIAIRLARIGIPPVITELAKPMAVRRLVSFCQAIYDEEIHIEEISARLCKSHDEINSSLLKSIVPVIIDPPADYRFEFKPDVIIDCRMTKQRPDLNIDAAPFIIGIGPGFIVGENCHSAVESKRGHYLGRVMWNGSTEVDTGEPESVGSHQSDRVLRAPDDGIFIAHVEIGQFVKAGATIAEVNGIPIKAVFDGFLRGLLHDQLQVTKGVKVGDVDPRLDQAACHLVSDKALAIGGGVLEALLMRPEIRNKIC
jgi:xanthine dehydrogenase accessory factor